MWSYEHANGTVKALGGSGHQKFFNTVAGSVHARPSNAKLVCPRLERKQSTATAELVGSVAALLAESGHHCKKITEIRTC